MENDTLYELLVGIDEDASASLMNQQLQGLGAGLKDLQIKIRLDDSFKEEFTNVVNRMKTDLEMGGYTGPNKDIFLNHEKGINKILAAYGEFGATITNIFAKSDGSFNGLTMLAKNAAGDIEKIKFDEKFQKTSSQIFVNLEKGINDFKAAINTTEKALANLLQKKAAGKSTPLIDKQEIELTDKLNLQYVELFQTINKSSTIDERRREELLGELVLLKEKNELARQSAQEKGKDAEGYERAKKALKDYKAELELLTKIQLGQNDSKTEAESKRRISGLKGVAKGYQEITKEMEQARVAEKENFKIAQVKQWETQYNAAINTIQTNVAKLQTAYEKLNYSQQHGDTSGQAVQQSKIDKLGKEIEEVSVSALKLGGNLNKLDSTKGVLSGFEQELSKAKSVMMDTGRQAEELEKRFGKLKTETASGAGMEQLIKQYKEGSISAEDFAKNVFGVGATVKDAGIDNSNYAQMTNTLKIAVKDASGEVRIFKTTFDEASKGLRVAGGALDSAKASVVGFKNQIMDAAKKIATWGLSTKIVYGTWRAFQDGIEVVRQLDKELTQIAIVQGTTRASAKELGDQYAKTAVDLAQTVQDVAKLNTELVRQGLTLEESAARADTIMKLSSAGMVSMEQSLQVITTGVNALGETHQRVADVILKASMLSASDVEGLGEAFSKTASGAKAAGLSIEETSALLATMKEITQEGDSQLGTSLKSMLARFSKINEETGEMNEDLNQVQTAIESVGIEFTDASGQIRSFYDITEDLSVIWDDLDKNTQAYIATQAAGVRQQNRFFAVMDNFNKVQAINNDLTNAAGTLQESYATYLQSSEAASKKLEAAMQQLWINFIDSDVLIQLTNLGTSIVKVVDSVGLLNVAVMILITKFGLLNKATMLMFKQAFVNGLTAAARQMVTLGAATSGAAVSGKVFTAVATGQIGLMKGLGAAAVGLKVALSTMFPALILTGLVAGAFALIGSEIKRVKEEARLAREEMEKIEATAKSHVASEAVNALEIEETFAKIIEYRSRLGELNSGELREFYELNNLLISKIPEIGTQLDNYGNKIVGVSLSLEDVNKAQEALKQSDFKAYLENVDTILAEKREFLLDTDEATGKIKALYDEINQAGKDSGNSTYSPEQKLAKAMESNAKIIALQESALPEFERLGNEAMDAMITTLIARGQEVPIVMQQALRSPELLQELGKAYYDGAKIDELINSPEMQAMRTQFQNMRIEIQGVDYSINQLGTGFESLRLRYENGSITLEQYKQELADAANQTTKLAGENEGLGNAMRAQIAVEQDYIASLEEQIMTEDQLAASRSAARESFESEYATLGDQLNEYAALYDIINDKKVTNAELDNLLLSTYPQWMQYTGDRIGLEEALGNAFNDTANTQAEAYITMLENTGQFTMGSLGLSADMFDGLASNYSQDIMNSKTRAEARIKVENALIQSLGKMWSQFFAATGKGIEVQIGQIVKYAQDNKLSGQAYQYLVDSATKTAKAMNTSADVYKNTINSISADTAKIKMQSSSIGNYADNIRKSLDGAKKSAGGAAKSTKDMADAAKEAEEALKAYNEAMKATQDATKEVFDFALKYIEWIEEQKREAMEKTFEDAEKAAEDAYDTIEETLEKEKDAQLEVLDIKEKSIKAEDELLEYLKKRQELQEGIVDLEYQIAIASFDSTIGGVKRRRELEEALAEERKQLAETEEERLKRMEEEAYARERAFIESQAEWERIQAEETKNSRIANAQAVFDAEKAFLDQKYSDEEKYLLAKQATQSGMIANLQGEMIPLVAAFKELAIANGEFWTFFGQQQVADFGTKVTEVLAAIKKLGFETIQTWKEVASAANNAMSAASAASSASGGSGGGSASSGGTPPKPTSSPTPPTPKMSAGEVRALQTFINRAARYSGSDNVGTVAVDGDFGPATQRELKDLANTYFGYGKKYGSMNLYSSLMSGASGKFIDSAILKKVSNLFSTGATPNYSVATSSTKVNQAYAEGGKIDYTGPAQVHGSKSKPEYVFNYAQFKDLAKMIAKHELTIPNIKNAVTTQPILVKIDKFIEVKGSVDKDTLPELKRMSDDAIAKLTNKLKGMGK